MKCCDNSLQCVDENKFISDEKAHNTYSAAKVDVKMILTVHCNGCCVDVKMMLTVHCSGCK